jgi:sugar/nucleoside kinase (ribokinase family)
MNATRALAAMGAKAFFVGMIGRDDFGKQIKSRMSALGINSRVEEADESTGSCAVLITPDGERTMNTCLGASSMYDADIIPHQHIKESKILHFTGYQWSTPHQKAAIKSAMKTASASGTLVSFDVADPFMVQSCGPEFLDTIKDHADIVFANAEEARQLFGTTPEQAADKIAEFGAIAVIKLGAKGAIVVSGRDRFEIAPVKTTVVDTTAAGDMFAGGFLYGLAQGKNLATCGKIAATLASDVISRIGAILSDEAIIRARKI